MLRNYLKVAIRVLTRNKAFSLINIAGLAIGLATCMLIMLYILDEKSYDQYHRDADRIYRVAMRAPGIGQGWAAQPAPVAASMQQELPEVEVATRLLKMPNMDKTLITWHPAGSGEGKRFFETNGYYVDSSFFQVFTYDMKWGNSRTALDLPNSVVISESVADRFFGSANPIGQPLTLGLPEGDFVYTVRGVFRDGNLKSHIPAHFLMSMKNSDIGGWVDQLSDWVMTSIFHTYVKLKPGTDPVALEKKINRLEQQHAGEKLRTTGLSVDLFLQPLTQIYLHSAIGDELAPNGNIRSLYILGSIAIFLLVIACINFMNLSTARSEQRAREVGVRKVLGAERRMLVMQFLGESFLMSLLALGLALLLAKLFLPAFNELTGKDLQPLRQPGLIFWIAGLAMVTGLLAGLYPAFYLSAFQPVRVLKGYIGNYFSATLIRRVLVVFQFCISIGLILGAIVSWRQMSVVQDQDLGFSKEQKIVLPMQSKQVALNYTSLRDEIAKTPGVRSVTCGSTYPGIVNINDMLFYAEGKTMKDFISIYTATIEQDYFRTLGLTLLHGRELSINPNADTTAGILNETAVKSLGYDPAHALGRHYYFEWQGTRHTMEIIGVVKDFNFQGLQETIKPYMFTKMGFFGTRYAYLLASLKPGHYSQTLSEIGEAWKKVNPTTPFDYSFIDRDFQKNYEKEQQSARIVADFTVIAIIVACLGLFGLASFSAEQRRKEIGIRKVLGASSLSITRLLSRDFVRLVAVAMVIALPLSALIMSKWLEHFAGPYRVSLSWWMFAIAGAIALLVALLTVSVQSARSAMANPVESLRNE
ncbi:MAG: ABC transporter permease [Bacteroidota bacterium]|nr:ABC transporter permease [Bacteroidota bacterium]